MPLPLIAVALIAAGAASGGTGVALGGKGAYDMKKARDDLKRQEQNYLAGYQKTESAVAATNDRLQLLGVEQSQALTDVVLRMGEFLRRHEKLVRESERLLADGIDVTVSAVEGRAGLDPDAVAWVRGVVSSAVAGTGASAGLTGLVTTYGVASTGATISGLSGAAAESATLAFLGGGSLASGGGGMALGATVLNAVTIGPALLVGGFVVKGQGTKARTKARKYEAKVKVGLAELKATRTKLRVVDTRTDELSGLLGDLVVRAVAALDLLESEAFDPVTHAARFQTAMMFVMAVRDVAATPVVDGAGDLNEKTADFAVKYRPLVKEDSDG